MSTKALRKASVELLGERRFAAHTLRTRGLTFEKIGDALNVSANRARELYKSAEYKLTREPGWMDGLSVRAGNAIMNYGITNRSALLEEFNSGRLHPKNPRIRNYGWKSHIEIAKWLGFPEPKKTIKVYHVKTCPHCGYKLTNQ